MAPTLCGPCKAGNHGTNDWGWPWLALCECPERCHDVDAPGARRGE
jgi:hypothetical protein